MTASLLLLVAIKAGGVDLSPIPPESCWAWATNVARAVKSGDPHTSLSIWERIYPDNHIPVALAGKYLQDSDVMRAEDPYAVAFMDCHAAERGDPI